MDWKIPRRFKAVNRQWDVLTLSADVGNDLNGRAVFDPADIYLRADMDEPLKKHTFLHECLHVVEMAIGMKMSPRQLDAAAGVIAQIMDTAEGEYDG